MFKKTTPEWTSIKSHLWFTTLECFSSEKANTKRERGGEREGEIGRDREREREGERVSLIDSGKFLNEDAINL
jgi:hypothetical protein